MHANNFIIYSILQWLCLQTSNMLQICNNKPFVLVSASGGGAIPSLEANSLANPPTCERKILLVYKWQHQKSALYAVKYAFEY